MAKAHALLDLARRKFRDLTPAEVKLFIKVASGRIVDCSSGDKAQDDPTNYEKWGNDRYIRADCVVWLTTNSLAVRMAMQKGIGVKGASIEGSIDFQFANVPFPVRMEYCHISSRMDLQNAQFRALSLRGSHIRGICGEGMRIKGDLLLDEGFISRGEVEIVGSIIEGELICSNAKFINPLGDSLDADLIRVRESVHLDGDFTSEGQAHLRGAQINGQLNCENAEFLGHIGEALSCDGIVVDADVYLNHGFNSEGEVNFYGAQIGGQLSCDGSRFASGSEYQPKNVSDANAFCGMQMRAKELYLCDTIIQVGRVDLEGAVIEQCLV